MCLNCHNFADQSAIPAVAAPAQSLAALPVTTQPAPPSQPLAPGTASAPLPIASLAAKPAKPVPTRTASAAIPLPPFTPQPASATQP